MTGETQPIMRMVEVLPAPFGPEEAERLTALQVEVDRVDRSELAEPLDEPARLNQRFSVLTGHLSESYRPPPGLRRVALLYPAGGARAPIHARALTDT